MRRVSKVMLRSDQQIILLFIIKDVFVCFV